MKRNLGFRALFGIVVVVFGGVLLAHNLGIITINWAIFWSGLFLLVGLSALCSRRTWIWGTLLMTIGAVIGLKAFNVLDVSIWKIVWPAILIGVGLGILFKPNRSKTKKSDDASREKVAIFYGEELRPKGDYDGGSVSAVFGGVELDLRQATVKDGAVIEVFAFCGGIEVNTPDDVIINNEVRGILGGSEDKTSPKKGAKKTLHLRGECILGGLEIK
ncbi:MAG: DUF5668 domain-containing protein [Candidatus Saccharibacteria bacterium]|nr:DUF5668 domain-containing protein [Candidatus Saccharibacteria bacterium]